MPARPLVLAGPMGAGKSTVGRLVARRRQRSFQDLDLAIERHTGTTVPTLFRTHGESRFRQLERDVLSRLLADRPDVVGLGGGAFAQPEVRALCRAHDALVVVLLASPAASFARIGDAAGRPLLDGDRPVDVLERLARERAHAWELADIRIDTDNLSIDDVVQRVLDVW